MEAGAQANAPSAADNLTAASGRNRRGAAAVEVAVVLPLFFLLAIGSIDIGRVQSWCSTSSSRRHAPGAVSMSSEMSAPRTTSTP